MVNSAWSWRVADFAPFPSSSPSCLFSEPRDLSTAKENQLQGLNFRLGLVKQSSLNKLAHICNGNTTPQHYTLRLADLIPSTNEVRPQPLSLYSSLYGDDHTSSDLRYSRRFLLQYRGNPNPFDNNQRNLPSCRTSNNALPQNQRTWPVMIPYEQLNGYVLYSYGPHHNQTTPRFKGSAHAAATSKKRSGCRIRYRDPQGRFVNYRSTKGRRSRIHPIKLLDNPRTPPSGGVPGALRASEECHSIERWDNAVGGGARRRFARRAYRRWRASCNQGKERGADSPTLAHPQSTKATQRTSKWFRQTLLWQEGMQRKKKGKPVKTKTTPPLDYHAKLRVGSLNVQGMADTLKLKSILNLMATHNLDVVMLSETRSTNYYSYTSEQHLVIMSGNSRDKYAGVGAVIHPSIRPHLADVVQISNRILHLSFNKKGGRLHVIGVYAPHSGLDFETVREPFWTRLEEVVEKIPQPEPVYVTGDFNVRFQASHPNDLGVTGPFTYGKGRRYIDHSSSSNRSLCVKAMQTLGMQEVASYRTPNPSHHITYRDKTAPPADWSQFVLDPLILQQFYDKLEQSMGTEAIVTASYVRAFLLDDPPLPPHKADPTPDPIRFQRLDHTFTRRQWMSSVNSCRSKLHTGFPSDHFLLVTEVQVKLAQRTKRPNIPTRLNCSAATPKEKLLFNDKFKRLLGSETPAPMHQDHTARIVFYTDGSGTRGKCSAQTPAGWGWCAKQGEHWLKAYGPVVTSPANSGYIGATVGSNNTGELSAIIEALLFALENEYQKVHIFSDSTWAIQVVTGRWRAKSHKAMVEQAQRLARRSGMEVKLEWIKAHAGHEGNELADSLANIGKQDHEPSGGRTLPFQVLTSPAPAGGDHTSKQVVTALKEASHASLPFHRRAPRTPWIREATLVALETATQAEAVGDPDATKLRNQAKRMARKDRVHWVHTQLSSDPTGTYSTVWTTVRRQRKGFSGKKSNLLQDGVPQPWSRTHEVFRDHLSNHQWAPKTIPTELAQDRQSKPNLFPTETDEPLFTLDELRSAIRRIKPNKAPGPDELPADLFTILDPESEQLLLRVYNLAWASETTPREWSEATVVSIFKGKGSDSLPENYRPISLLNAVYKLYAAMLQARLLESCEHKLRPTQFGFRPHRSTLHPLFTVRRAMEWSTMTNTPLHLLFLDWKQAFDSLDHTAMLEALARLGLSNKMLAAVSSIYRDPTFITKGFQGQIATGTVGSGIRQGCPLSPYLFILVLTVIFHDTDDLLLSRGVATNTWSTGFPTYDLEYADDTLLMGLTESQLNGMLQALETVAQAYGMSLNQTKTELLANPNRDPIAVRFTNGSLVKTTPQAKYLGSLISWDKPFDMAFTHRFNLAEEAFKKLRLVWNSSIPIKEKVKIFQATYVPSLIYGLDALTLTTPMLKRIDGQYYRFLRRVVGVKASYYSRITNAAVWDKANNPKLPSQFLFEAQYKMFVNVFRQDRTSPTHAVVFGPNHKDRILLKGRRRGMQFPYWVEVYSKRFFPNLKPEHTFQHQYYDNIQKALRDPSFVLAPKRAWSERAWP